MNRSFENVRRKALVLPAALVLLAGSAAAFAVTPPSGQPDAQPDSKAIEFADSLSAAFRDAAAKISPSVVNITTTVKAHAVSQSDRDAPPAQQMPQIPEEFRRFFQFGPQGANPFGGMGQIPEQHGQGSGVIIRQDGYILTNNHVVDGADDLTVRLQDGRELDAKVVGTDPDSDLAVIHIDAKNLPAAHMGNSDSLQPGDWVVAVGNPFGLDHTVTAGIVSATGRGNMGLTTFEDFIQTDAAINPGNSGGPMVNLHGDVIGINSAIRSASGGNNGVGFAIPATLAGQVADSLISSGHVERGWLGVSVQLLTPELAASLGQDESQGALVADVMPDTPAAKAGLESGDIITRVDQQSVDSPRKLMNAVASHQPGEHIKLAVDRDGSSKTVQVVLGERPGAQQLAAGHATARSEGSLGIRVQPLTPELASQLGVGETQGLVITEVESDSPAARAGLQPEDIVLEAARQPVHSSSDLTEAAKAAKDRLLLKISRDGHPLYIVVKIAS
ncbi:MAG: DegQ family serine endoprotease [Phycisphaerales bacterium]|nr:DegQ family serine endoprotease [Phycisphaerales bacterium]